MAEEYKKPIITVKLQVVEEMDPGLKLMIQRRQASQWDVASWPSLPSFYPTTIAR